MWLVASILDSETLEPIKRGLGGEVRRPRGG